MARALSEIENEIRNLARPEQEQLLRALLEELDGPADPDAERAWLDEVQRRSADFDAGLVKSIPAEKCSSAFARVSSNEARVLSRCRTGTVGSCERI
jgi:putative addiction module component (TIGR02574 family)